MNNPAPYDLAPLATLLVLGAMVALLPLAIVWRRHRGQSASAVLQAVTLMTLFLTFDLIVFGAFTRLTDSGLGCPDWPGCYGHASPLGAHAAIGAAQQVMPTGPVTHGKAWIEMVHRYLATAVGALVTLLMVWQWLRRRHGDITASPGWATLTFFWVCAQGAFGALTVTMKLYPAIVTAHLLGGLGLLALLAVQAGRQHAPSLSSSLSPSLSSSSPSSSSSSSLGSQRASLAAVLMLTVVQVALGGWVSTNYAVLACSDVPTCQGQWWPPTDFANGFSLLRNLGETSDGGYLPFAALTAIHLAHRIGAVALVVAMAWLVWRLAASGSVEARRWAGALAGIMSWQLASGLGNVLLGWPLASAVAHTAGAAALVGVLTTMLVRSRRSRQSRQSSRIESVGIVATAVDRTIEVSSPQGLRAGVAVSKAQAS